MRFLVEDSLASYTQLMLRASEQTARVLAPNRVELEGPEAPPNKLPLFVVDLLVEGSGQEVKFGYSTPPDLFLDAPLACFDKALTQIQNIVRVERKVRRPPSVIRHPPCYHPCIHRLAGLGHLSGISITFRDSLGSCDAHHGV
jgi:hypothetical protein